MGGSGYARTQRKRSDRAARRLRCWFLGRLSEKKGGTLAQRGDCTRTTSTNTELTRSERAQHERGYATGEGDNRELGTIVDTEAQQHHDDNKSSDEGEKNR